MSLMDTEDYILAIDQGTSSSRALLFAHDGRKVIESYREVEQSYPHNGWVEMDPNKIWTSVLSVISDALIDASVHPEQIMGIGVTNQRETTVVWDKQTGEPIYNAIGWASKQTTPLAKDLTAHGYADMIHEKTGLVVDAYFSATKLRWILDHVAGAQGRAERGELLFGTIDTWLIWKLTGGKRHVTDFSNASRTMMFNIHDLAWDSEILSLLNIPEVMLPRLVESDQVVGATRSDQFFGASVPIAGIAGDQSAAMIGQRAFEPGMVKNTYGDGAFIMLNTGSDLVLSSHDLLTTIAYKFNGQIAYALEGSVLVAGSALSWLADTIQLIDNVPRSRQAAMESTDHDEVYVVPAFYGLGAPYWDQDARGAAYGLTRGTTRDDFVKATLQSIAYQTRDILETMNRDSHQQIKELLADGGSSRNRYLMQFQADILNLPVQRSADEESTALGVALLAGLATGFWNDFSELSDLYEEGRRFNPEMTPEKRQHLYRGWQTAVKATRLFKPDNNE
ncbi:glycerol kinase GlpK [Levilactobacillus bambusae]|uniref:Glycerol kinase n=1 Tax=Levilactobacillus bambusae TaxID=2024736 RepID=A0A2V1MY94_9LACO|nr:glycerol kinase GlpK [Levilactobacillus bambusae]PWF99791.1 glycerol kinase [Levilactobacillus bambusae]